MILGAAADIPHGQAQKMAGNGGMGDARRRGPHQDLRLRVVLPDQPGQPLLHIAANRNIRQSQPVVTVHRTFDAGSPGEGRIGPEKDRLNFQQALGNLYRTLHLILLFIFLLSLLKIPPGTVHKRQPGPPPG